MIRLNAFTACALAAVVHAQALANNQPAPGPAAQNTGLVKEAARITDERIQNDRITLDSVQQRLRKLNEAGVPQSNFALAKAQCWLDTAKTQYHENDRTGYVEESLAESAKITKVLEADKGSVAGIQTPLVAKSTYLRKDLWEQLGVYKADTQTLACTAQTVACAEVRLVRAGHAEQQTGWRQATPHVQMVEDGLRRAAQQAKACAPVVVAAAPVAAAPPPASPPPAPPAPPAPPPAPIVIEREVYVLHSDALFVFDKGQEDRMLSGGTERLAAIAEKLKAYKSIDSLVVIGHTDRFGSDEYNDKLSAQRASTVQAILERMGVKAKKVEVLARGKREPVTAERCAASLARPAAIACLQPDRRVVVEARGIVK